MIGDWESMDQKNVLLTSANFSSRQRFWISLSLSLMHCTEFWKTLEMHVIQQAGCVVFA
jgi:hypothetical protein